MAGKNDFVTCGIDTHKDAHTAAVIGADGERLGHQAFCADRHGYRSLLSWLSSFGIASEIGIEATGSYGLGIADYLRGKGLSIYEVTRPDKVARRARGKSDVEDAYQAAYAAASKLRCSQAKHFDDALIGLRALKVAYDNALKARTSAKNAFDAIIVTAPPALRESLNGLNRASKIRVCARYRNPACVCLDATLLTKSSLKQIACRIQALDKEIGAGKASIESIVAHLVPHTLDLYGVGPLCACQFLLTTGTNVDRIKSEASFARLCGVAPLEVSSGKTKRHRLSRAGDRKANSALYTVAIVRMSTDEKTQNYVMRKLSEGKTKKEVIRLLKRYIIREVLGALKADLSVPEIR
jgi:transposase